MSGSANAVPWYVRTVVGIGAWVTAVVLTFLGGAIVFSLLNIDDPFAIVVFGVIYLAVGLWLLRNPEAGTFAEQFGIATAAAGAAMVSIGLGATVESIWAGFAASVVVVAIVIATSSDRTLQFLVVMLAAALYVVALVDSRTPYVVDFVALATPAGLALLLLPPRRDVLPAAFVLLLTFPVVSVLMLDMPFVNRSTEAGGTLARILHILLFLGLVFLHWRHVSDDKARLQTIAFAVVATAVCLLLPPGGSAAMLLLMVAFVTGSRPLALLGALLQVQFMIRYYYTLDMNLFDKSLLLMAVGVLLLAAWWLVHRSESPR